MSQQVSFGTLWRRGWWALLMLIVANVALGLGYASVAFLLRGLVEKPMPIAIAVVWLTVGAPFLGWLFELFATHSARLTAEPPSNERQSN